MADRRLRRHLSKDEMNRGIGMIHSELSQRHVANVLGVSQIVVSRMWTGLLRPEMFFFFFANVLAVSQSVVSIMWNRFITTGNVRHLHAGGGGARTINQ